MTENIRHRKPIYTSSILLILFAIIGLAAGLASCSSVSSLSSTPTARSFAPYDTALEQDSLRGYVALPNSRVWLRSLHTSDTIFLELRTRDTLSLRSLLINGVSVWIDPQGKQKENFGVSFPAARAEILRRQEEILQQRREQGDTLQSVPFEHAFWVETMQQRNNVITDNRGTRFATPSQARMELETDGSLVYRVAIAYTQMETTADALPKFSVGVISERHQAQLINQGQGAQRTGATDQYGRPRQAAQPSERPQRMGLIPVRGWIIFSIPQPLEVQEVQEHE